MCGLHSSMNFEPTDKTIAFNFILPFCPTAEDTGQINLVWGAGEVFKWRLWMCANILLLVAGVAMSGFVLRHVCMSHGANSLISVTIRSLVVYHIQIQLFWVVVLSPFTIGSYVPSNALDMGTWRDTKSTRWMEVGNLYIYKLLGIMLWLLDKGRTIR